MSPSHRRCDGSKETVWAAATRQRALPRHNANPVNDSFVDECLRG